MSVDIPLFFVKPPTNLIFVKSRNESPTSAQFQFIAVCSWFLTSELHGKVTLQPWRIAKKMIESPWVHATQTVPDHYSRKIATCHLPHDFIRILSDPASNSAQLILPKSFWRTECPVPVDRMPDSSFSEILTLDILSPREWKTLAWSLDLW